MEENGKNKTLEFLAYALAFSPFFFLPLANPDIFWHLNAGKQLFESGALLTADTFSWSMKGGRWDNFEWLSQAAYYLLYSAGGFAALSVFKGLLLSGAALLFKKTLETAGVEKAWLYLPLFSVTVIQVADARPDNFSLLGFAFLVYQLTLLSEKGRGLFGGSGPRNLFPAAVLFAVWANLHAGFVYGLALLALFSAASFAAPENPEAKKVGARLWIFVLTGAIAALANPLGWRVYSVILEHAAGGAAYAADIEEWGALDLTNPMRLPVLIPLILSILAAAAGLRRRKPDWPFLIPSLAFFAGAARHVRLAPFFAVAGLAYALKTLAAEGGKIKKILPPVLLAAPVLYYSLFLAPLFPKENFYRFRTEGLAPFLNSNAEKFSGLKMYNPYNCGGWLAFETGGKYPVFMDGRYLFAGKLAEFSAAIQTPAAWEEFLAKYGFELAVFENLNQAFAQELTGGVSLPRPFYLNLFDEKEWAMIYWDRKYLVFAKRAALARNGAGDLELGHFRANDFEALEYAVKTGRLPPKTLEKEMGKYFSANPAMTENEKKIFRDWAAGLKKASDGGR